MIRTLHRRIAAGAALAAAILTVAGCAGGMARNAGPPVTVAVAGPETLRPAGRPASARVPEGARTAAAFDIVTPEQRAAALAAPAASGRVLGETVASLGAPSDPGLWLRTGLVDAPRAGRVTDTAGGASVAVELRPSGREPGSGSELSLSAFMAMNLQLTALPRLRVQAE